MSKAHSRWVEEQEQSYARLLGAEPRVRPAAPDDWSPNPDACLLWIRRQGWGGRVEDWMIEWVMSARA